VVEHIFGLKRNNIVGKKISFGFCKKQKFDIISLQFALHYFFQSEQGLNNLVENIRENLNKGGYLIGTCFEDTLVYELLPKNSKHDSISVENHWEIKKGIHYNNGVYGREISVYMESIGQSYIEYLVNFEEFQQKLKALGIILLVKKNFESYYIDAGFSLEDDLKRLSFLNISFIFQASK
jgi:mRNA (guanine-N7-)-methyltransferase